MRNNLRPAAIGALALILSGCAFVAQGTKQKIKFESKPAGASVYVNGRPLTGVTPLEESIHKEDAVVVFKKEGFHDESSSLKTHASTYFYWSLLMGVVAGGVDWLTGAWREFDGNGVVSVNLRQKPGAKYAQDLTLDSDPKGADVYIDGKWQGKTSISGPLLVGRPIWSEGELEKAVKFTKLGYKEVSLPLPKGKTSLTAKLEPQPDIVSANFASEPARAAVWVDDKQIGTTPCSKDYEWYVYPPYTREVEFRLPGYKPLKMIFSKDKSPDVAKLELVVEPSRVKIETVPAGAEIEIDGKLVGTGPAEVDLQWSVVKTTARVKCFLPGYEATSEVTIQKTTKSIAPIVLRPLLPKLP